MLGGLMQHFSRQLRLWVIYRTFELLASKHSLSNWGFGEWKPHWKSLKIIGKLSSPISEVNSIFYSNVIFKMLMILPRQLKKQTSEILLQAPTTTAIVSESIPQTNQKRISGIISIVLSGGILAWQELLKKSQKKISLGISEEITGKKSRENFWRDPK